MANQGNFPRFQNFYFPSSKDIYSLALSASLPAFSFEVLRQMLDSSQLSTDDGISLRKIILEVGALDAILNCLSIFTHHSTDVVAELTKNTKFCAKEIGL